MWLAYVKMIAMELNKNKNSGTSNTSTSDRHLEGNALPHFAHPPPHENAPSPHFVNHSPIGGFPHFGPSPPIPGPPPPMGGFPHFGPPPPIPGPPPPMGGFPHFGPHPPIPGPPPPMGGFPHFGPPNNGKKYNIHYGAQLSSQNSQPYQNPLTPSNQPHYGQIPISSKEEKRKDKDKFSFDEFIAKKNKSKNYQNEGRILLNKAKTRGDFLRAKEKFEQAWKEDNTDINLADDIREVDCHIHIALGDEFFNSKAYLDASFEYQKALSYAEIANLSSLKEKCKDLLEKAKIEVIKEEEEEFEKLRLENLKERKIYKEKFKREINEFEKNIDNIEKEERINEEINKKRILNLENYVEEKKLEMIREIKEKELYEKSLENKKIKKANIILDKESTNLILEEKENLKAKLLDDEGYMDEIKNYFSSIDNTSMQKILFKKSIRNIGKRLKNYLNKLLNLKDINILLVGETGAGKSTLVNSVLQLPPECQAETGSVKPCTMGKPKFYSSNNPDLKNINLVDSRGFERDKNYSINIMEKEIIAFINEQKLNFRPIHLVWYCFKGSRFEDSEDLLIKNIMRLNIPVLLVYTQAVDNTIMDFEMITNKGYEYVEIIAKDIGKHIKSFGLDELKLKSNEYINNNYINILKDSIIYNFTMFTRNKLIKIKEYFEDDLDEYKLANKLTRDILFLFEDNNFNVMLFNKIKSIINNISCIIKKYVFNFIQNNNDDLFNKLIVLQQNINFKNGGILTNLKNREQWKRVVDSKLKIILSNFCLKNAIYKNDSLLLENYFKFLVNESKHFVNNNMEIKNIFISNFKNNNI